MLDVGQKVELADTGTIVDIELYFVAKVDKIISEIETSITELQLNLLKKD